MDLSEITRLVQEKFEIKVDTSGWDDESIGYRLLFQLKFQNSYLLIRPLHEADYFDFTFFKSTRRNQDLIDDCIDVGVTFRPKTIYEVKTLLNTSDS